MALPHAASGEKIPLQRSDDDIAHFTSVALAKTDNMELIRLVLPKDRSMPEHWVEGDRARGTWDILSPCTTGEGRAMWMAGVEHDEYARTNGVWLHTHMKLDVVFMAPHDKGWSKRRES